MDKEGCLPCDDRAKTNEEIEEMAKMAKTVIELYEQYKKIDLNIEELK